MAKRKRRQSSAADGSDTSQDAWASLTWDMLEAWAGQRTLGRGRTYQRQGRVADLQRLPAGGLLAEVNGSETYVVRVAFGASRRGRAGSLESVCTCPVGWSCKHAVAAVLELLARTADGKAIAMATPEDPRLAELAEPDDAEEDEDARAGEVDSRVDEAVHAYIRSKDHGELVEWVWSLFQHHPAMFDELRERIALETGDAADLLASTRGMIADATSEPAWYNRWDDDGYCPDYAPLQTRLEHLLEKGYYEELIELGEELFEEGRQQVELSHDEGETAMALGACMEIVCRGVVRSSRSGAEKLLFAIDLMTRDDHGICDEAVDGVFEADYTADDWSAVADVMADQLALLPSSDANGWASEYRRRNQSRWLTLALDNAGRTDELTAVYESEARATGHYNDYVRYLMQQGQYDQARRWAHEGLRAAPEKYPGIVSQLVELLTEIARQQKQWTSVATYAAYEFFTRPSQSTFRVLIKAADKAACREAVEQGAMTFLETGRLPWSSGRKRSKQASDWPLPLDDVLLKWLPERRTTQQSYVTVLLDIAIDGGDNEAVLHWYDVLQSESKATRYGRAGFGGGWGDRVAAVVADSHPERALGIYQEKIDALVVHADRGNYEEIGTCLRQMRPIYDALNRPDEWQALVDRLRTEYSRRPRFVEVLDTLDGTTILDNLQAKRSGQS